MQNGCTPSLFIKSIISQFFIRALGANKCDVVLAQLKFIVQVTRSLARRQQKITLWREEFPKKNPKVLEMSLELFVILKMTEHQNQLMNLRRKEVRKKLRYLCTRKPRPLRRYQGQCLRLYFLHKEYW